MGTPSMWLPRAGLGVIASLICGEVRAASYEYTYQGNPFDTFAPAAEASQFTPANRVVFSFVTNSALPASTTIQLANSVSGNYVLAPNVSSWSVTDGTFTYGSSVPTAVLDPSSAVTTGPSGSIVSWNVIAEWPAFSNHPASTISSCGVAPCVLAIGHSGLYAGEYDQVGPAGGGPFLYSGYASTPDSWATISQYWDGGFTVGDGVVHGGNGVWGNKNWTTSTGTSNSVWQGGIAIFQGAAGTVTLCDPVSFQGLQFLTNGYVLNAGGGGSLLPKGIASILVGSGLTATIGAPIAGAGGTQTTGAGTLVLSMGP